MSRPPNMTFEQYRRVLEVKAWRKAIPSDKHLAREMNLPEKAIERALYQGIVQYDKRLAREGGK